MKTADINIAQSRGDAVMVLLERARIAPFPVFYSLLYDYVAGVQSLDAKRAGSLVDTQGLATGAGDRLYDEFVRPYVGDDALERVVASMVQRLTTLDALLVERQEVSRSQSRTLSAATARLSGGDLDAALMRDWVGRLSAASETARHANAQLTRDVEEARQELAATRDELARLARDSLTDPLTTVANRKGLDGALSQAVDEVRDTGANLSVAVVDIDHFKRFNDAYGHPVGDGVLKLTARALLANVRDEDVIGRMGGDEFVAVLPGCTPEMALARAEAIRTTIRDSDLGPLLGDDVLGSVTVSIGVASYRDGDSIASLLDRADNYLFEAKQRGRNRVVGEDDLDLADDAAVPGPVRSRA